MLFPLEDHVIVEKNEADSITKGGIHLPDTAKQETNYGKVLKVGPGKYDLNGNKIPMDHVLEGYKVYFSKYSGSQIEKDGKVLTVLRYADILAVEQS